MGAPANDNLSGPQKELLKWRRVLGTRIYCIQSLMCMRHYKEPDGTKTILPAMIKPKYAMAQNFVVPPCQSCLLAWARKHPPKVSRTQPPEDHVSLQTSSSVRCPDCQPGMDKKHKTTVFKAAPSIMMQHWVWYGSKIRSPLMLTKPSWARLVLNKCSGTNVFLKSNMC